MENKSKFNKKVFLFSSVLVFFVGSNVVNALATTAHAEAVNNELADKEKESNNKTDQKETKHQETLPQTSEALQNAIDEAKGKGIKVNVENKNKTVLSSNVDKESKKIQKHYEDEVNNIKKVEKDYADAQKKADDDYNNALKNYQDAISKLPNPGGVDPNTIHNNISLPNQGEQNGNNVSIVNLNSNWQSWTGYKDADSDNGWKGGKANTPSWIVSLPGGWVQNGNKVTVIAPKDRHNVDTSNIGTIKIKLAKPGYYHDPVTGKNTTIAYLQTKINSIGNRDANHYRDSTGGHYQNLLYSGDLGLTGSWAIDSINNTDQFLDDNGNPINFEHGGGYLNDLNQRMNEKDTNGKVIDWADPNNPDTNHWWRGPKEWNNWTKDGGHVFYGTASQWGNGAEGHSYIGSSVFKHDDGFYYSDQSNFKIWNAGAPMNGSIVSTYKNNPAYNQTANHNSSDQFASSGAMLNGLTWDHQEKLLDSAQNSFGNLAYMYDATIPPAQDIPNKPVKKDVPAPKVDVDLITLNSITPNPDKTINDQDGESLDGTNMERGDTIPYQINWDLTNLEDLNPTADDIATGLSITDNYSERVAPDKKLLKVVDKAGKDITNLTDIIWNDKEHSFTVKAKDANEFFKQYKGSKVKVDFSATVIGDGDEDILNTATQNTFGEENKTNTVINHQPKMNPKKDIVLESGSGESEDGKDIKLGQVFDYKIGAERPDNYGGQTKEWSISDTIPKQDRTTGQWQVYATNEIKLNDDQIIKKGTDISKYFTFSRDEGKVDASANQDLLNIINSKENKKNKISYDFYFQVKRVDYGKDITNVADESYNKEQVKTNKVTSNTIKPEEPKKEEPKVEPKQDPKPEVKEEPKAEEPKAETPKTEEAPKTGHETIFDKVLGLFLK